MIRRSIEGVFFKGERFHRASLQGSWEEWDRAEQCVKTKDSDYVDDVNICIQNEEDLIKVDEIFLKFEEMSGAILNRDSKTKIMGIGDWKGADRWVLPWIKTVPSLKIFGIIFHPTYQEILEDNWGKTMLEFDKCLLRFLNTENW